MSDRPGRARSAPGCRQTGATVLLKGATQLVGQPGLGRRARSRVPGPAWTGQAGSGDVLGGICAALLAAGPVGARRPRPWARRSRPYDRGRHPGPIPPHGLAELAAERVGRLQLGAG